MMPDFDFTIAPQDWTSDMWREAIKAVVRFAAQPYEDLDDLVTAGWILGQKRAALQGHRFWPGVDPICPFTLTTLWFWKPSYAPEVRRLIFEKRYELVRGIHEIVARERIDGLTYVIPGDNDRIQRLMRVIPDDILTMPISALHERIAKDEGHEVTTKLIW
jgi:hypothetical protein